MEKLKKIKKQAKLWLLFGCISPIMFLLIAIAYYGISNSTIPSILYTSWVVFITISLIWWAWVIKVVHDMAKMMDNVFELVNNVQHEVAVIHDDMKNL
jgi:chromate transport protein ChrA